MKKRWLKKVFSMVGGAMVGVTSFGVSVQTFVLGATELKTITDETKDLEAGEYSISTPEELAKLARLVDNEHATAEGLSFLLTTDLDLTEGGEYTHGYCDKPTRDKDGKVVGWYEAEEKDGGTVEWTVAEPDLTGTKDIDEKTEKLEENGKYVIRGKEGYNKFMEPKEEGGKLKDEDGNYPSGISVVLLGGVDADDKFVEPVKDEEGKLLSGWCEAQFEEEAALCKFRNWKETGNGGGALHPYRIRWWV